MWPIAIIVGILIAYFILKFTRPTKTTEYYKSEPKAKGSPLMEEDALVGAGLATRGKSSVMDSTSLSPAKMVVMSPSPSSPMAPGPMMPPPPTMAPGPMMPPPPMAPGPMMPPPPMAPGPMMASGSAPVTMSPSV